jgi:two-component system, OmpR family, alkaline phosphatase synthesis response regulator PhoP
MASEHHILVVEDEKHLATGIRYNLEAEGYTVTTVGNGPQALELLCAEEADFDLLVLDLMLPGMSGYAVCEAVRADGNDIPVLILSARSLAEDRVRGFDVGADQYLTKPFDLDEFISRVKNLLVRPSRRTAGVTPDSTIAFGEAVVDFDTFEVTVAGESVRLTQLEMKLLRYFVTHAGRVIPRDELLREVWEVPGDLHTRAPDQFIHRLRKAFEPDPGNPRFILTIRDAGYRFVAEGRAE